MSVQFIAIASSLYNVHLSLAQTTHVALIFAYVNALNVAGVSSLLFTNVNFLYSVLYFHNKINFQHTVILLI